MNQMLMRHKHKRHDTGGNPPAGQKQREKKKLQILEAVVPQHEGALNLVRKGASARVRVHAGE